MSAMLPWRSLSTVGCSRLFTSQPASGTSITQMNPSNVDSNKRQKSDLTQPARREKLIEFAGGAVMDDPALAPKIGSPTSITSTWHRRGMGHLVTAAELADLLTGQTPPVVLDVRWRLGEGPGRDRYDAGHIPGAVFVDLESDLASPPSPQEGRHPLPSPDTLERALRRFGINDSSTVVIYDDGNSTSAARGWWVLRWAGLSDVRVMDGGLTSWTASLTSDVPSPEPGTVTVKPGSLPILDADGAAALARHGVLLDARAGERYRGEVEPFDPVAGHIPGAINAPTTENLAADGRFATPSVLRSRFQSLGVGPETTAGVYCGSGVTAAHQALALAIAGFDDPALYPGSWSQWSNDPARPVATGPTPG